MLLTLHSMPISSFNLQMEHMQEVTRLSRTASLYDFGQVFSSPSAMGVIILVFLY